MERAIRPPVLECTPTGRKRIESVLRDVYGISLGGFWRWLYYQGEIDSANPPEDLDPVIKLMDHASINHKGVQKQECKKCAVWMILWDCWRVVENSENVLFELVERLESLRQEIDVSSRKLFGKGHFFLRAFERLPFMQELRRSDGKVARVYPLSTLIELQNGENTENGIIKYGKNVSVSIRRLRKDICILSKAIENVLESSGMVFVRPQDKEYLLSKVAYDLKDAGFKPIEIADMLNGQEPLSRDRVGYRRVLSAESALKRDRIVKRIQRFSENVKRQNQDADKTY